MRANGAFVNRTKLSVARGRILLAFTAFAVAAGMAIAVPPAGAEAPALVKGVVDDAERITLAGNVPPLEKLGNDLGPVEDSFAVDRLYLILKRSDQQEEALAQFLKDAHTPGSASYHKWLTPEEFGERFGAADSDVAAVKAWLESHGFTVNKVHAGRIAMEFSGNAAQVKEAFHTEIHRYSVPNEESRAQVANVANVGDPQIPAAFASLVAGISPMHSFHAQPMIRVMGHASYNARTHTATPEWTYPASAQGVAFELGPADFAAQYDIASVYRAGTTGTGVSIGILSQSNIDLSLVQAYQNLFGLPANLPAIVVDGNDPGQNDAATEAYLDVEQSLAVAPGANVILYTSAGSILTDPLLTSGLRALEDNQVSVISMSYGSCESSLGASGNAAWALLWQEAAAQGITGFVSAGDSGTAGCDDFDTESFAESGLAVNGLGSTPYNVSVGGTDFYYSDYAASASTLESQINSYWSFTGSDTPVLSLLQPAPEQAWNNAFGYNASDGGVYSSASSTIVAGGGGASSAAIYPASGPIAGYPKPLWQAGIGVPNDRVRDLPDVSLFAANGSNFVEYPICAVPGDCVNTTGTGAVQITSVGGTSAASPAMAGIQALVDQATKSRQGLANIVYYALASKTLAAKPFRDITVGGNEVPCFGGTANCVLGTSGQTKGDYAESGYVATTGYDRTSGLGTVDVANLIANWSAATFKPTATTLSITPTSFAHGTAVTVKASVAPKTGTGTGISTGSVVLNSTDSVAYSNDLGVFELTGGSASASIDNLPGGTYQVIGNYSGDGTYSASASAPVTVTVTPEKDTLNTSGWVLNPVDGNLYPILAGMSIPYGSEVFLDTQPVGVNEVTPTLGQNTPATGAIVFIDRSGTAIKTTAVPLNGEGLAEWIPSLALGSHAIGATYAGDGSYNASTAASVATLTVFKGTTTLYLQPMETSVPAGSNVTVDLLIFSDTLALNGTLPTGVITVTLGNQTLTVRSPFNGWGETGSTTQEAVVTFTNVPAGILPLSASYGGDGNWYGCSSLFGSVESLSAKPAPAVTLTTATTAYTPNQTVTMTGTVTGNEAMGAPKSYVYLTWEDGSLSLSSMLQAVSATSSSYAFVLPAWQLANGTNTFVVTFKGDTNYSAQSSSPLSILLNASDFSVIATTQEVAVTSAKAGSGTVVVSPINSYSGTVAFTCSAPAGISCTLGTASATVGSAVTEAVTLAVSGTVPAGTYPAVVIATGGGHTHTAQILMAYTPPTAAPSFSLAGGTYTSAQTVAIGDATAGATLYYTTDGSTPTGSSAAYAGPIAVKATETLKAVAIAPQYSLSAAASASYTIAIPAAMPTFSPAGGTYSAAQTVTISDATAGATIHYTINGTTPTNASTVYSAAVAVRSTETLKAIAVATGYTNSSVGSAAYTINAATQAAVAPTFSPAGGTYNSRQTVTISDSIPGTTIYYTVNGATPTTSSSVYQEPVAIPNSLTLKAIAVATGGVPSNASSATYTLVAAGPVITPASGTYHGPVTVRITSATPTVKIFYTTSGNIPTTSSAIYTGPITITGSGVINAMAAETGFTSSPIVKAIYTIETAGVPPSWWHPEPVELPGLPSSEVRSLEQRDHP